MREAESKSYRVFISHSSIDTWVAEQIRRGILDCGADAFLDSADIGHGDDVDDRIMREAERCDELLVLLTPWGRNRPYIWMEVSLFWRSIWVGDNKRIVPVLHGPEQDSTLSRLDVPNKVKQLNSIALNDMPTYFLLLGERVQLWKRGKRWGNDPRIHLSLAQRCRICPSGREAA